MQDDDFSNVILFDRQPTEIPILKLCGAVLEDAWGCLRSYRKDKPHHKQHRHFIEAYEWFMTSGDNGVFSFDSVCNILNIQPEPIRKLVRTGKFPTNNKSPNNIASSSTTLIGGIHAMMEMRKYRNGANDETVHKTIDDYCDPDPVTSDGCSDQPYSEVDYREVG